MSETKANETQPIARLAPSRLPIVGSLAKEFDVTPDQWRVLIDQIFPSAKSVEAIGMALSYCRARKLDIFKKPVHIVPMWSSVLGRMVETVWPGIAEVRTTAARTGEYAGIDAVEFGPLVERTFTGQTGRNGDESVTKTVKFPEWASVVVYRITQGERFGYNAKIFWEETYATIGKTEVPNDMWAKRPRGQFDKCVEAAALRKAFPEELGNTYVAEEMEGRVIEGTAAPIPEPPTPAEPPAPREPIDKTPPEDVNDDDSGVVTDPITFLADLEGQLAGADTKELVAEVWEFALPEVALSGDTQSLTEAFDLRKKRLAQIELAGVARTL